MLLRCLTVVLILAIIPSIKGQCPDGSLPVSTCVNGGCQGNFQCFSGACCNPTNIIGGQGCPAGSSFVAACPANQVCPQGSACAGSACCTLPGTGTFPAVVATATCPDGSIAPSQCTNGFCGAGYTCNVATNLCCITPATANLCPNGVPAISSCLNSNCPIGQGYGCTSGNLCCPGVVPVAPVIPIVPVNNFFTCPNGLAAVAACLPGQVCGQGYVCTNSYCCPPTAGTIGSGIIGSNSRICPNTNTAAVAACFTNQTCGQGYSCIGGYCCPPGNTVIGRRKRFASA